MGKKKMLDGVHFGKSGKDSARLASCKNLLGKIFSDRVSFNTALQDTKAKVVLADGKTTKSKMKVLGAIAVGKYNGKATIIQLPNTEGHDRIDYAVKLLDNVNINWDTIDSVGSLSK